MITQKIRKQYIIRLMFFLLWSGVVGCLSSCSGSREINTVSQDVPFPSFKEILNTDEEVLTYDAIAENAVLPVKIYFDNTGSMEGFTISKEGKRQPCSAYAKLIRCLRDMGRMQDAEYYILDVDIQDWVLYEEGLYDNFYKEGFHIWWKAGQPGPLSKLYMDGRIDENYINIVLTDLAEQNLNNTQLAEQIQKMCDEKRCEADLYAFKFEFNGLTQTPNPNAVSGMLEENVNGEKPYYMIITGPSNYMEKYRQELKSLLEGAGLEEGVNYFTATNKASFNYNTIGLSNVVFEPFADYDDIFQESKEEKKSDKENNDNEDGLEIIDIKKSKNLLEYEYPESIFEDDLGIELAAFYYQKVEGVSKKQDDWRLNFYIPLNDWEVPQLKYTYKYQVYSLEQEESKNDLEETETIYSEKWMKDENPRIEVSMEILENFEETNEQYPAVLYVSCKDKMIEEKHEPRDQNILLILEVTKEETYFYEKPDWLSEFDTGNTDDYFTRTFNLNGFYDILFGNKNKLAEDGAVHIYTNYIQIPILLMGLKE